MEIELRAYVGVAAGFLALAAAGVVFRAAPDRRVAWRYGLLLVLEAIMIWTSRPTGPFAWASDPELLRLGLRLHMANDCLLVAFYLPALAVTIRSPMLRPFDGRAAVATLATLGTLGAASAFVFPDLFLDWTSYPTRSASALSVAGPAWLTVFALLVANYTMGLMAALLAWRSAHGALSRRRAGFLALAFGIRDIGWGTLFGMLLLGALSSEFVPNPGALGPVSLGIYVCLTAYGIASANLFDIDLRVKWTLERGTVAAVFVAVFFVVSEGVETLLSDQVGSVLGILATGALVFLLAPLQRVAERISNRAMPSVQDTDEYKSFRKLQVYGEALGEAMLDGVVTPIERAVLDRLRIQLDLSEVDAMALERELGVPHGLAE
jgi:hypothetical protein